MFFHYFSSLILLFIIAYLHALINRTVKANELKVIKCVDEIRETNIRNSNSGPTKELIKSVFLNASILVEADLLRLNRKKSSVGVARSIIPGHSSSSKICMLHLNRYF
jgi:hypothetical protein